MFPYTVVLIVLFVKEATSTAGVSDWYFSHYQCHAGEVDVAASNEDFLFGSIFYEDLVFQCSGQLDQWKFFTKSAGTIYLSVWREKSNLITIDGTDYELGSFELRGTNKITVDRAGLHVKNIPNNDRIFVSSGDIIGVYYDVVGHASLAVKNSSQSSGKYRQIGKTADQLYIQSSTQNVPIIGATGNSIPSVSGRLIGADSQLRLHPDTEYRGGRAEVIKPGTQDTMGTICDRWVHLKGWPNNFCLHSGFPGVERIAYTRDTPERYYAAPTAPISLQSPNDCKASLHNTISSCPEKHRKAGACSHDLDVYVRCAPKVRCRPDKFPRETESNVVVETETMDQMSCVPQIFLSGDWGHICDVKSPHLYNVEGLNSTWMTGFCKEMGYPSGAVHVMYAIKKFPNYSQSLPILSHSPECVTDQPTRIDQCPPGIQNSQCDHTCDFWVTCGRPAGTAPKNLPKLKTFLTFNDSSDPQEF